MKNLGIKLKLIFKQNLLAFGIFILWFLINYCVFLILTSPIEAVLIIFYFLEHSSLYGHFYPVFSEFVIFGLIFSLITVELFRKYNPKETCRLLSSHMTNHVILIGYSHLAERIYDHLRSKDENSVVIENNEEKVEELIDMEAPVIVDNESDKTTLQDANIEKAKLVIITDDDVELLFMTIEQIRELNSRIKIIARCFDDDIARILENNFIVETISTSKFAADRINKHVQELNVSEADAQIELNYLIIGANHISERLGNIFNKEGLKFKIIDIPEYAEKDDFQTELSDKIIIGDPMDKSFLMDLGVKNIKIVILVIDDLKRAILILNNIRELNKNCYVISRVFSDNMAEIISKAPFNAIPVSSSKESINYLLERNYLSI
ncbi:MAG: NAD-binding protein [Candidatus Helarchaeota archaeon]